MHPLVHPSRMAHAHQVTTAGAMRIGDAVGVDWRRVTPDDFRRALETEILGGGTGSRWRDALRDDEMHAARLAWARLRGRLAQPAEPRA